MTSGAYPEEAVSETDVYRYAEDEEQVEYPVDDEGCFPAGDKGHEDHVEIERPAHQTNGRKIIIGLISP